MNWSNPLRFFALVAVAFASERADAASGDVLRTAREVRELSVADAAERRPAELSGVVLGQAEPEGEGFVLRDATDSIYAIGNEDAIGSLVPGDRVEVSGHAMAGDFAPYLAVSFVRKIGVAPLPEPTRMTADDLFTKGLDAQWIVVSGVVRDLRALASSEAAKRLMAGPTAVERRKPYSGWMMTLAIGDRLVPVQLFDALDPAGYIDAEVEIRGLCFNLHNAERQFLMPVILVPHGIEIRVLRPPPAGPFELPLVSSRSLFQFHPDGLSTHRVHIEGVVLHQLIGTGIWIRDHGHGFFVRTDERSPLQPGDRVQVAGFPERGEFAPVLAHAVYRKMGDEAEPAPVPLRGLDEAAVHNGDLVRIEGELLDRQMTRQGLTLRILAHGENVDVRWSDPPEGWSPADLEPGSRLAVAGICILSVEQALPLSGVLKPDKFGLLVRQPADIVVLQSAPWWTPARVAVLLAGVIATLLAVLVAVFVASRRRLAKERALRAIEVSNYSARLAERSRMARDLHDNVAQGFGAISLQLELAGASLGAGEHERSSEYVSTAQQLVRTSMIEVRSFIRNLRTQTQQDVDLGSALKELLSTAVEGASMRTQFSIEGTVTKLATAVEAQIIRLTQEAVSNAVRHSGASELSLVLRYSPTHLEVTVADNGKGFDHTVDWAERLHFGLLGMKERAALVGGELAIESTPHKGTRVVLTVRLTATMTDSLSL